MNHKNFHEDSCRICKDDSKYFVIKQWLQSAHLSTDKKLCIKHILVGKKEICYCVGAFTMIS
ncbi:hypothetical protein T07_10071 [Trichinella nelsoni]|uniref:Uncharacterized protein n=1 Tax=Trichinella nelsoni TaxID=6336 RepID=A0A0V0S233_9BILA|nr:hypothetical protein T07_10071 [Trichinella nelsoni]